MKTAIITAIALSAVLTCSCTSSPEPSADNNTVIGISCAVTDNNSRIGRKYSEAVIKAGGTPFLLPVTEDTAALSRMLDCIDALILTGGEDLNPAIYGEVPHPELGTVDTLRDGYDLYLVRTAASRGIPVLGICRGEQLINIAFGGTLYQDIPTQKPSETDHYHKDIAPGFRVAAWSPADSIVEAIECIDGRPIWGVQFHPEGLTAGGDTTALNIFRFIVSKGREHRSGR